MIERNTKISTKSNRIAGASTGVIFNKEQMNTKAHVKIVKTCLRPIMTYACEKKLEKNSNIIQTSFETAEMQILRNITCYPTRILWGIRVVRR